jgi:hypothetical protein
MSDKPGMLTHFLLLSYTRPDPLTGNPRESAFSPGAPLATFSIEVAAPKAAKWCPFPGQELPLAEYAREIVERFDFDARVSEVNAEAGAARRRPGIIVIDPEFIADESMRAVLGSVAGQLPRWVLPLVIVDSPGDPRIRELAAKVRTVLNAGDLPTESARRGAAGAESLAEFVSLVSVLVAEAERQYLRHSTGRVASPRSAGRPRLAM